MIYVIVSLFIIVRFELDIFNYRINNCYIPAQILFLFYSLYLFHPASPHYMSNLKSHLRNHIRIVVVLVSMKRPAVMARFLSHMFFRNFVLVITASLLFFFSRSTCSLLQVTGHTHLVCGAWIQLLSSKALLMFLSQWF